MKKYEKKYIEHFDLYKDHLSSDMTNSFWGFKINKSKSLP